MSHFKERAEKICLNCGTELTDRYCPHCGQQNVEPKETFGHLLRHFLEDLTHFDGKFFVTMKDLFIRPGFLTTEYIRGKRASYLNPIRMFLFISTVFFLLQMSFFSKRTGDQNIIRTDTSTHKSGLHVTKNSGFHISRMTIDSIDNKINSLNGEDSATKIDSARHSGLKTTVGKKMISTGKLLDSIGRHIDTAQHEFEYKTVAQYDSQQNALPPAKRDGFLERMVARKTLQLEQGGEHLSEKENNHVFLATFYHMLPYMLFLSVPLLALLFKLIYIRRKQFYYVAHTIFIVHFFSVVYLLFIVSNFLRMGQGPGWQTAAGLVTFAYLVYLYIAMLNFYKQGWLKTFVKFWIVFIFGWMIVGLLMSVALAISLLEIA